MSDEDGRKFNPVIPDNSCPNCGEMGVLIMHCQSPTCDEKFCKKCHADCKIDDQIDLVVESKVEKVLTLLKGTDMSNSSVEIAIQEVHDYDANAVSYECERKGPFCPRCLSLELDSQVEQIRRGIQVNIDAKAAAEIEWATQVEAEQQAIEHHRQLATTIENNEKELVEIRDTLSLSGIKAFSRNVILFFAIFIFPVFIAAGVANWGVWTPLYLGGPSVMGWHIAAPSILIEIGLIFLLRSLHLGLFDTPIQSEKRQRMNELEERSFQDSTDLWLREVEVTFAAAHPKTFYEFKNGKYTQPISKSAQEEKDRVLIRDPDTGEEFWIEEV